MSTTQTHVFSPAPGETGFISFSNWINTLPADEQTAATAGLANQTAKTAAQKANGEIVSQEGGQIVWADAKQIEVDPVFKLYFDRYTTESGVTHTMSSS